MILCTFSGKIGDILWSLPTVKEISNVQKEKSDGITDFAIMPQYERLLSLLNAQSYIHEAYVIPEWACTGSPCGDQPWQSPNFSAREVYEKVIDLTYKEHPHGKCLMDWIAEHAGVTLIERLPFLEADYMNMDGWHVAYAFNEMYAPEKRIFVEELKNLVGLNRMVDVSQLDWKDTAAWIKSAVCFVGCRSSNYVLAHGLDKRVIVFEPHPMRVGPVFDCPHGVERQVRNSHEAADQIESWLQIDRSGICV